VVVAFEGGMPLVGLAIGAPIAGAVSGIADWIAAAVLVGVGVWMLASGDEDAEEERVRRLSQTRGLAVIGLGIGISLDELAIGFSLGLAHLSVVVAVIAIVVQAVIAVQLGLTLGARVSDRTRENVERVAAVALIVLGTALAIFRF
jgi:putative Mn2+ efflux pump MntP